MVKMVKKSEVARKMCFYGTFVQKGQGQKNE